MAEDENLEKTQTAKMLEQMQTSWEDIEVSDRSLGFNDLSLEKFRQDLFEELQKKNDFYRNMPKGIFTGFESHTNHQDKMGIAALLKNRTNGLYELIYIDSKGNPILQNQKEVLDFLAEHKEVPRFVDKAIDRGDETALKSLHDMIQAWVESLSTKKVEDSEGNTEEKAGAKTIDLLNKLKVGQKEAVEKAKSEQTTEQEFDATNYDLIVWFIVT
jgi:hypothetical protein